MPTQTLVMLRHGESRWNLENRFTGWVDVDLSDKGLAEAKRAGEQLKAEGFAFDVAYTSVLKRAIRTLWLAMDELDQLWVPVVRTWRLNERHYGALQGLDKAETAARHGEAQVKLWRRSYDTPPPPLSLDDPGHPRHDRRYRDLTPDQLPSCESLKDTLARVLPFWNEVIASDVRAGKQVLIAAHGNSLRALVKHLDGLSDQEVLELNIPTGIPLVYQLDENLKPLGSRYLGDAEAVKAAAAAVARQGQASR